MVPIPRVAAIQDISGLGRCSLTVILPVLSAMGVQCCPAQTAYLSAHTGFPPSEQAAFLDMTPSMEQTLRHWGELHLDFQAIYSGFLGSAGQIDALQRLLPALRGGDTLFLVDPVMGDHGKVYRTYTPEMCQNMRGLAAQADLITPNLTEAALLLEEPYSNAPLTEVDTQRWLHRLSNGGRRSVIITGIRDAQGKVGAACLDRATGRIGRTLTAETPAQFPGTGDLFAAVTLGALLGKRSLDEAVALAVEFVAQCTSATVARKLPVVEGVVFEPLLGHLASIFCG